MVYQYTQFDKVVVIILGHDASVMFSCVFVTLRYDVSGQMWYLIVSIPDLCLHLSFVLGWGPDKVRIKPACSPTKTS